MIHLIKKIDKLPISLKYLNFNCDSFNKKIDKLPKSIKHIILRSNIFIRDVNLLPCLNILNLNINNNNTIDNLPKTIKIFYFNNNIFNNSVDNLNNELITLHLHNDSFNQKINNLPISLNYLLIKSNLLSQKLNKLPINTSLYYYCNYDDKLITNASTVYYNSIKEINLISNTTKTLFIGSKYNKSLDFLPEGLEILDITYYCNPVNDLPSSIKELYITKDQTKFINKIYHNKIKYV